MKQNKSYELLKNKISAFSKAENSVLLTSKLLNSILFIGLLLFLNISIEAIFRNSNTIRELSFFSILTGILLIPIIIANKPLSLLFGLKKYDSIEKVSLKIGKFFPEIKDRLSNAIQLLNIDNKDSDLINNAFDSAYQASKDLDFKSILDRSSIKRSLRLLMFSFLPLLIISSIYMNSFLNAGERIYHFQKSFLPPIPFVLSLDSNQNRVKKGEDYVIEVNVNGEAPEEIILNLKEGLQDGFTPYKIKISEDSTYKFLIKSIKNKIVFNAEASYFNQISNTDNYTVEVINTPIVKSISGNVRFPSYTKLLPVNVDESSADISALIGSNFNFEINSNNSLASAKLVFESLIKTDSLDKQIDLKVEDKKATGSFKIDRSGTYKFIINDTNGESNLNPITYKIIALRDEYPDIELIQPENDINLSENQLLAIQSKLIDDYGISKLTLQYRLSYSKYTSPDPDFTQIDIPITSNDKSLEVPYIWDLTELGISPEDKYEFYLEVFDNDLVGGPKSSKTSILTVKLPSLDEVFAEAEKEQDEIEKDLSEMMNKAKELKKDIEDLEHDLRKNYKKKNLSYDEQKRAEKIEKDKKALKEKMKELSQSLNNSTEKMSENKALSKETLQKYQELQELMNKVSTPEMKKQSQKMNEELNKMSPKDLQKMLEKTKYDEKQFLESIERTMKMLKKIQSEQKMDEIIKKAKEMEEQQKEIKDNLKNSNTEKSKEKLVNKQKELSKDLDKLDNEMDKLSEMLKKLGDEELMKEFEKAQQQLNKERLQDQIQQAQQEMQQGNNDQAMNKQEDIEQSMNEFAQQMQKMKQEMMKNQMQQAMNSLQKASQNLNQLSKNQEKLMNETKNMSPNSTKLPEIQRQQGDINEGLEQVARELLDLSEKSFAVTPEMGQKIGEAMSKMQQSQMSLAERNTSKSSNAQRGSMAAMNQASTMMQQQMDAMGQQMGDSQGSGGQGQGMKPGKGQGQGGLGFSQQLSQAAAQQQMLRNSLQQMMKEGQGGQNGKGQGGKGQGQGSGNRDQYGRLKKQIGNAQKSIEELNKEKKNFGDEKVKKDLKQLENDLNEILNDIESGNINEETLKRQEKILSKLLDAQRSLNKRDYQSKRKSKSGKDYKASSPEELDLESIENKEAFEQMLKELEQGYSKDYEKIIKKYYKEINKNKKD